MLWDRLLDEKGMMGVESEDLRLGFAAEVRENAQMELRGVYAYALLPL